MDMAMSMSSYDDSYVASAVAKTPAVKSTSRKYCITYKNCMSSKSVDFVLVCVKCRKHDCNVELRCDECSDWSLECMTAYVRYCSKLEVGTFTSYGFLHCSTSTF